MFVFNSSKKLNQLEKKLSKLKNCEQIVFNSISRGMDYNYKLKYFDKYRDFLNKDLKFNHPDFGKVSHTLFAYRDCDHYVNYTDNCFKILSDNRRLELGVDTYLFDYCCAMTELESTPERLIQIKNIIKRKISKNHIKRWQCLAAITKCLEPAVKQKTINYEKWSQFLHLSKFCFSYKNETYNIVFPDSHDDTVYAGYRLNTCLGAKFFVTSIEEGKSLTLLLNQNGDLFSSLHIKLIEGSAVVTTMRTFNNRNVSEEIKQIIQNEVNKIRLTN